MEIKLIKFKNFKAPKRAHWNDSGADVFAAETVTIEPGKITKIPTGVGVEIPAGYDGVIHCKSGMSSKGCWCANAPIDSGYNGEIHAIVVNLTDKPVTFEAGEKVGQLVLRPVVLATFVEEHSGETRGDKGFGSTGNV